ncbi:MAG: SIMPL domain-containing protein [Desulfobacterales bacterium]|nr:SIMPL domain-containing protein [Desulfobacterales bacterium]
MRLIIAVAALLCLCHPLTCPAETQPPKIRVVGEHKAQVAPDHAVLKVRIRNKADSARATKALNQKTLQKTLQILSGFNIKDRDIETYGPYMTPGITSASTVRAIIRDFETVSAMVHALSTKSGTKIEELRYGHSQLPVLMKEAQTLALLDAKQTALSMAETLGADLGEVIFIQEQSVPDDKAFKITHDICIRKRIEVVFRLGPALNP